MSQNDEQSSFFWNRYLNDFICQYIIGWENSIKGNQDSDRVLCISLLESYFSPLMDENEMQRRMLKLHIHTAYNLLNLKRLIRTLIHVDENMKLADTKQCLVQPMQVSKSYRYGALVHSVISNLFSMLKSIPMDDFSRFKSWILCYFNMVCTYM